MRFMTMEDAQSEPFCPADRRLLRQLTGESVDHAAKARALFLEGYNCAQAVVGAFADELGMTQRQAVRLASSFGGGMGGMPGGGDGSLTSGRSKELPGPCFRQDRKPFSSPG